MNSNLTTGMLLECRYSLQKMIPGFVAGTGRPGGVPQARTRPTTILPPLHPIPPRPPFHIPPHPRYLTENSLTSNVTTTPQLLYRYEVTLPSNVNCGDKFVALLGNTRFILTCPKERPIRPIGLIAPNPPDFGTPPPPQNLLPETIGRYTGTIVKHVSDETKARGPSFQPREPHFSNRYFFIFSS